MLWYLKLKVLLSFKIKALSDTVFPTMSATCNLYVFSVIFLLPYSFPSHFTISPQITFFLFLNYMPKLISDLSFILAQTIDEAEAVI